MNGGGKSSLMNLFYSTFQPESRRFLGAKADGHDRKLSDYVKAGDLAVIVTEWQMPVGKNLFSSTRVVGQVLAWRGGVAAQNDEARLEREFFTFRGSETNSFDSLPFHGLGAQPLATIAQVKDWLAQLGSEFPALEIERGDQSRKGKWRETLDRVGIDTELFNYHLKMNVREGGAAALFTVRDTMEFVDLFLEMAFNPTQADKTREQIEAVREKLLRLPQKETEERFAIALLDHLRPLVHEAAALSAAEFSLREQRRSNYSLLTAIEDWISATRERLDVSTGELSALRQSHAELLKRKLGHQEYRLNYNNLARELTFREAQAAVELTRDRLRRAVLAKNLAVAGVRFARISSRQQQLEVLMKTREAELADEKPVLDDLHLLGAGYVAALGIDLDRIADLLDGADAALSNDTAACVAAQNIVTEVRNQHTRTNSELENVKRRLTLRDRRRAALRDDGHLLPDEKGADAAVRWGNEQRRIEAAISDAELRIEHLDGQLEEIGERIRELDARRRDREKDATGKDRAWQRGDAAARRLRESIPIREVLATDCPNLDFPDLPLLLHARKRQLEDEFIQGRVDRVDDERTLHSFDLERLFPPSREVELVLAHLRDRGLKTALPAYRFLATNATLNGTARQWLAKEPARFSGIVITSEEEFGLLQRGGFAVSGLRHPVQVTLSANPDDNDSRNEMTVALPSSDGAFNYERAASEQRVVETRLEKANEHLAEIDVRKNETAEGIQNLCTWRDEFGGGALHRLAAERDQLVEEVSNFGKQLSEMKTQEAVFRIERNVKQVEVRSLRPQIGSLIERKERLRGYVEEYERHEAEWLAERREKITLLEQLAGAISAQEREVTRLLGEVESRKERVRVLKAELQGGTAERERVRFHDAPRPEEPPTLETGRARYQTAVSRYEEQFGRSALEGQIKQAELQLAELRDDHRRLSSDLSAADIALAARHPDLAGQQEESERQHLSAHSIHEAALAELAKAERDRPEAPAHKQGLGLPPGEPVPMTAAEAVTCREKLDLLIEAESEQIAARDGEIAEKERECQGLESSINARMPHRTTLEDLTETNTGPIPALPKDDVLVTQLVSDAKRRTLAFDRTTDNARSVVDARIVRLQQVSGRPDFAGIPAIARDRLSAMPREELLQRCGEFVQSHEAWQRVLRNEIETLDKDKDLVVRALDGVATSAVRLLGKADRASIMPDAFPGWTGQPFLRITAQPVTEPAARRDRLAALVTRLVNEKAIPTGHALASAALREIGGPIRVTLLKPEDPLRPDRHDITEFGTFSGGEKMTAAVLLYVTLAQLRIRGRDEHTREREAGVLLLDNPFGTASKREFVELQLRVARQMGVQLIYTTGVNDLGALDVLPRILRLRKRHRDRRSGDLLLSQEPPEEHVDGVQANLRP